jgi:hypothetical protein
MDAAAICQHRQNDDMFYDMEHVVKKNVKNY